MLYSSISGLSLLDLQINGWQGVYVLTDNSFKPFSRMSMALSSEAVQHAQPVESRVL